MPRLFRPVAVTIGIGLLGGFGIAVFAFLLARLVLGVVDAAPLPVFGPSVDQFAGPPLLLGLVAWTLAAPIVASRIRVPSARRAGNLPEVPGGFLWFIAVLFGEFIGGVFYPAGA